MDLTRSQWKERITADEEAVIIDVRNQAEINAGYIPKMKHLDITHAALFIDKVRQLDPNKSYYIYCHSGSRSGQACAILKALGFEKTYNLLGGFASWDGEKTI